MFRALLVASCVCFVLATIKMAFPVELVPLGLFLMTLAGLTKKSL